MLTKRRLRKLLLYYPKTGLWFWKINRGKCKKGTQAGKPRNNSYGTIRIDGVLHYTHRLAFLYMKGYLPEEVDHDDRNKTNCKWKNLIDSTKRQNSINKSKYKRNKSGVVGVRYLPCGRWFAQIMVNKKLIRLGYFNSLLGAAKARYKAEMKYGWRNPKLNSAYQYLISKRIKHNAC